MPTYTRSNLRNSIWDSSIHSNISNRIDTNTFLNEIVRDVISEVDLRSTKRRAATSPNLFDLVFDISKPSDMKGLALIDIVPQLGRKKWDYWRLTTPEEFDRLKDTSPLGSNKELIVAVWDNDLTGKIRISVDNGSDELTIADMDTLTGDGGTWAAFDADTASVAADADDFVKGSGSIKFNINAVGGTTSGLVNTAVTSFDWSDYYNNNRSVFVWVKIVSTTNLTNWILRLGSSASAYDQITVTAQADGNAFRAGWNLLRFDFANVVTTGSPTRTAGVYAAIYMTKTSGKVSENGYKVDHIIAQEGKFYDIIYYSKFGWQNTSGTYLENSTADTDYLNADTEEFDLFVQLGRARKAIRFDRDPGMHDREQKRYEAMRENYKMRYPSEAAILSTTYQDV